MYLEPLLSFNTYFVKEDKIKKIKGKNLKKIFY